MIGLRGFDGRLEEKFSHWWDPPEEEKYRAASSVRTMTRLAAESTRTEPWRDQAEPSWGRTRNCRVKGLLTTRDLLGAENDASFEEEGDESPQR